MLKRKRVHSLVSMCVTILAVAISPLTGPTAWAQEAGAPGFETLARQFEAAEQDGDYQKALGIARRLTDIIWPQHLEALYDLARMYALTGDRSKAYEYLYWAVDSGYWNRTKLLEDAAFESLRADELFKKLAYESWLNGYLFMLEREEREGFQRKEEILAALDLKPGNFVADVGAGSGYFTIPIAKMVGPEGKVLATDIRQGMLDYIGRRLEIEQLDNVELLLAQADDPMLPAGEVDLILMVDVYHYILESDQRVAFGERLRTGLAPGGRLVVIDYIPKPWEERPWGPPPSQHLSKETLTADLEKAGFKVIEEYDFLPEQFFVVYGSR